VRRAPGPRGVLALLTLLATSCQGSADEAPTSRHLSFVGIEHRLCIPAADEVMNVGFDVFANTGDGPVMVDRVEWLGLRGLSLEGIRVFQHRGSDQFAAFGIAVGDPPRTQGRDRAAGSLARAWQRSTPAQDAVIPPSANDYEYADFIISYTGSSGSAGPLRVSYTDSQGRPGTVDSKITVTVKRDCG
jgi:hypothetical protein